MCLTTEPLRGVGDGRLGSEDAGYFCAFVSFTATLHSSGDQCVLSRAQVVTVLMFNHKIQIWIESSWGEA